MPDELIILSNAGDDLIVAITVLINKIKDQQVFPACITLTRV